MRNTLIAMAALMMIGGTPALAQDMMSGDAMKAKPMKMSAAQMKQMKACQAMSHDRMMKNAGCKKMMRMHPDMMKGDMMMKSGG